MKKYIDEDTGLLKKEQALTSEEIEQVHKNLNLANLATEEQVENLYKKLSSNMALGFYCIEDVTIVLNGVSTIYPANSNVEIKFLDTDVYEIIPTSDNSILSLSAFPGALGTYYSWLEGVKQFSNILFDMNAEEFYSKWSQGNQGSYQVQFAQYSNCIFWSDNAYVSDVSKRTNYTLYSTSQLPLCYSSIPDNTFKAFYMAMGVNSDPNWGNPAYRDSFAKATWATQVFSYYGARTIGTPGIDDPSFNITLPKDCRGLMFYATMIENAGTFDAINVTNFGAKSGSWRDAFGYCTSLRQLYIKNLTVNLNISWSPVDYDSIYFIIANAANTKAITISVSPYTYNLLSQEDFDLATSKNITIALITTNYVEDKRLSEIANKADKAEIVTADSILQKVYPVGAIYMSATEIDPAVIFEFGTWEQIKDTFLLAAGDTYTAGSIGGEAEHTLTVNELPSHTHGIELFASETGDNSCFYTVEGEISSESQFTTSTGESQPHNNMPPYLTVYMWKRIS